MVFAADEYYLMTGRPFPHRRRLRGLPDARGRDRHGADVRARVRRPVADAATGVRSGFFAAVDACRSSNADRLPSNPAAYTGLRSHGVSDHGHAAPGCAQPLEAHRRADRRPSGRKVIAPLIDGLGRDDVRVIPVANEFFGGNTGVTGLMTGEDVSRVLDRRARGRPLPVARCLPVGRRRFLDGVTVDELPRPVEIVATDGIALRRALGEAA